MTYELKRRAFLAGFALSLSALPGVSIAGETGERMVVTKTPSCGCCTAWADIARDEGFDVEIVESADYVGTKAAHEVPEPLWSCHSTRVGGYVVEGHVPLAAVHKLLAERPEITGIAVPGMPTGSPGMGDDPSAEFDVTAFGGDAGEGKLFYQAGL